MRKLLRRMSLLLLPILLFVGCDGKKHPAEEANRTPPPPSATPSPPAPVPTSHQTPTPPPPTVHRFTIRDIDGRQTQLEFQADKARFHRIRQPLVMIVLFADWCPPCRGMLPYLSQLQNANRTTLFVIGIPVRSDLDDAALRRFMERYDINFFLSDHPDNDALGNYLARRYGLGENYPLPLTLLYKNGKYLMHIEGAVPYEMLQNIVDQLNDKKTKTKE